MNSNMSFLWPYENLEELTGESSNQAEIDRLFVHGSIDERLLEKEVNRFIVRLLDTENVSSRSNYEVLASSRSGARVPDEPCSPDSYFYNLDRQVLGHAINTASPRFIGHMTAALPYFARPMGQLLTALNQNPVKVETSKALTVLERETLEMLHRQTFAREDEFYLRHAQAYESTLGTINSGGTAANITALWVARNDALGPSEGFNGVVREGLASALAHYGYRRAVIVGSELLHYSIDKAADALGLGERGLVRLAVDGAGRIDVAELRRYLDKARERKELVLAMIGIAGATESGTIDPLNEMADIAGEYGVHLHVDAAWGGPIVFSPSHRHKVAGIERADSVTIDGHKQLYLPMGIGVVMFRCPHQATAIEKHARYIIRQGSPDLGRRSLEGSRASMALFLHAGLNLIGQRGYAELIDQGIAKAHYLADAAGSRAAFELLATPTTNIVNYRYVQPELRSHVADGTLSVSDNERINRINELLQDRQKEAGRSFISRTTIRYTRHGYGVPVVVLRAVLANPLTTEAHIDAVLDEQESLAEEILKDTEI